MPKRSNQSPPQSVATPTNSPIALLRQGIIDGSWDSVCEAFSLLTGENLPAPKKKVSFRVTKSMADDIMKSVKAVVEEHLPYALRGEAKPVPQMPAPAPAPRAQAPRAMAPNRRSLDAGQFRTQNNSPRKKDGDGRTYCRVLPYEPPTANEWNDDQSVAVEDIEIDRKLHARMEAPIPRRDASQPVQVECVKCNEIYLVPPAFAVSDASYVCDSCLRSNRRSRD